MGSLRKTGRWTIVDFLPISLAGTASSNSNARTSVNRSAFILCWTTWDSSVSNQHALEARVGLTRRARTCIRCMLWGPRGTTAGGPTHLEFARPPLECFATVLAYNQWGVNEVNHQTENDVLELMRIRSPQLVRPIDRKDRDKNRITFADSVRKGHDTYCVHVRANGRT